VNPALAEHLEREANALASVFTFWWLLWALLVILAALLAGRALAWLVHASWRVGFDRAKRLAWWLSAARVAILGAVVAILVRAVLLPAPVLGAVLLLAGGATSLIVLRGQVENVAVGVGLVFRQRLKEGDHVTLGELSGVVREVGLSRLQLRRSDGSAVYVPNRLLNSSSVIVERARHTARVSIQLELEESPTLESLERLRRAAVLSPFRAVGTALTVQRDAERPRRVIVEMQTHSSALIAAAARQLEASLLEALRESGGPRRVE